MAASFLRKAIQMNLALWGGYEGGSIMYQGSELIDSSFTFQPNVLAACRRGSDKLSWLNAIVIRVKEASFNGCSAMFNICLLGSKMIIIREQQSSTANLV